MRTLLSALAVGSVVALSGCAAAVDEGDQKACTVWSEAQQAMVQTVAIIVELSKDPAGLTEDVANEFNTKRNQLLAAYDEAKKVATSEDLKAALETGLDKDSIVYYDLAGATDARFQDSLAAVGAIVATCASAGIDVTGILGTN